MISKNGYDKLSVKYLTGNCSKEEKTLMEQWIAVSETNKIWFEQRSLAWKLSGAHKSVDGLDVDKALAQVHQKIDTIEQGQYFAPKHISMINRFTKWTASAAAVLVLGLAVLFLLRKDEPVQLESVVMNEKSNEAVVLPDGSEVFMNAGSAMQYAAAFDKKREIANFTGEALFEVQSNPEKPFQLLLDNLGVEVLGTKFNLRAVPGSDTYTLDLIEGKVRLFTFDESPANRIEQIVLLPGERGVFDLPSKRLSRSTAVDKNFLSWKTGILEFVNTPLPEVVKTLNRVYGLDIQLASQHESLRLTARFEGETADQLIESLQTIFQFEVIRTDSQVYFR
ncbi:MAG: FecR domain-containing protein [Bacteroidetes bacterium]|nr:FecR domain-containing protein [Bacteroidota bacterium]MBU1579088.1 FecR domain-containing protein [Bacteroidota bacterium]